MPIESQLKNIYQLKGLNGEGHYAVGFHDERASIENEKVKTLITLFSCRKVLIGMNHSFGRHTFLCPLNGIIDHNR